jgi:hypothetical protein
MANLTVDILGLGTDIPPNPKLSDVYPAVDVTSTVQSPQGSTYQYTIGELFTLFLQSLGFIATIPVSAATTVNLNATYNNGSSGINAFLTDASGTFAPFIIDGIAGIVGNTYLIKNQTNQTQNGIYVLTQNGDGISLPWILIRWFDFNSPINIINGEIVPVTFGLTQANTFWQLSVTGAVVVGTSNLIFTQVASPITAFVLSFAGNPNGFVAGVQYQLLWDTVDNILYVCTTTGSAITAVWTPVIGQLTNGQLRIGSTGNVPVAATLTAGPGISIANGPGSITISGTGSGIGWNMAAVSTAMTADNGYLTTGAALVTLTLPPVAAFGTGLAVIGSGAGGWQIATGGGQSIQVGSATAATSVSSTNRYDSIFLICTTANTVWSTLGGPQGNLTIV